MPISFEQVIKAAPFDDQTKKTVLESIPTLNQDQLYDLTRLAWEMIAADFAAKLKERTDLILLEVAEGKRTYNKNDFVEAEVTLYHELANKFEAAEKEEVVNVLKEEITKHQTASQLTTNNQPLTTNNPQLITNNLQPSSHVTPTQGTPKPTTS